MTLLKTQGVHPQIPGPNHRFLKPQAWRGSNLAQFLISWLGKPFDSATNTISVFRRRIVRTKKTRPYLCSKWRLFSFSLDVKTFRGEIPSAFGASVLGHQWPSCSSHCDADIFTICKPADNDLGVSKLFLCWDQISFVSRTLLKSNLW